MHTVTLRTQSPDATRLLGRRIGEHLRAGDVVALHGQLGAGKTVLAQGIAEALGIPPGDVQSPTFTLCATHGRGRLPLHHLDVYRMTGPAEALDIGWRDFLAGGIVVVEWAEKIAELLPPETLHVTLDHTPSAETRQVRIHCERTLPAGIENVS